MVEIKEINLQRGKPPTKRVKIDVKKPLCDELTCAVDVFNGGSGDAVFLCFTCSLYNCVKCHRKHTEHWCFDYNSSDEKRKSDISRIVIDISKEENLFEIFHEKKVRLNGVAKVRHNLDREDCLITGITGVNSQSWVACDSENSCLKVFDIRSNIIQRYIKISAKPWDVTEIDLSSDNRDSKKKNCVGVTVPDEKSIVFLNLDTDSTRIEKELKLLKPCYYLEFCNDKVFVVCEFNPTFDSLFFLMILTIDGVEINRIKTEIIGNTPHIAVFDGLVYMTDYKKDTLLVFASEGNIVIKNSSHPAGIVVDQENNAIICASNYNKIYKLDRKNYNYSELSDQTLKYMDRPYNLCLHRGRLYIGHTGSSYQRESVTVVSIL